MYLLANLAVPICVEVTGKRGGLFRREVDTKGTEALL